MSSKLQKFVSVLRNPAEKTKTIIYNNLKLTEKLLKQKTDTSESNEIKTKLLKKLKKIEDDLKTLKVLTEDEIILFALTTKKTLMAVAANRRESKVVRMKARVASHKPLSSKLALVKRKINDAEQLDDDSENGGGDVKEDNSELEKIVFNKQVVLLRGAVKQAKVHTIHKLTKNVKKLRQMKGTDEQKAKFEQKAQRLVKKIKYIKEVESDEISKFALSNTKDLNKICSDVKMPMKTQAMATLALHKSIAKPVEDFKKKFPKWEKTVPTLLKKKKKQKLDIVHEKSDNGLAKINEKSHQPFEHGNEKSGSENDDKVSDDSDQEIGLDEESDEEVESEANEESGESNEDESDDIEKRTTEKSIHLERVEADPEDSEICMQTNNIESKVKYASKSLPENFVSKKMKSETQKKHCSREKKSFAKKIKPETVEQPKVKNITKIVDPFFITTTNEEYVTSQIPVVINDKNSSWKYEEDEFSRQKSNSFFNVDRHNKWSNQQDSWRQSKPYNREIHHHKPFTSNFEKLPNKPKQPLGPLGNRKERRKVLLQSSSEVKTVEKLHPSWEAKKKQSTGFISQFQGKKITFD